MMKKSIEFVLTNQESCCGCTACCCICPMSAIMMVQDAEGFLYPKIDQDACVGCLQCRNACPVMKTNAQQGTRHGYEETV